MTLDKAMAYEGLAFQCPQHWDDITDEVDGDDVPITIADFESGVGALQFTIALYKEGELPQLDESLIREMLLDYAGELGLGTAVDVSPHTGKLEGIKATYQINDDFLVLWFLTNGTSLIMATYNCEWTNRNVEYSVVEEIMSTVEIAVS